MKIRSLKFKLTVVYALFFTIIFVVYGGILYFSLHQTLYEDLDHELAVKAEKLKADFLRFPDLQKRKLLVSTDYVNLIGPGRRPFVSSNNVKGNLLNAFMKAVPKGRLEKTVYRVIDTGKQRFRIINLPFIKNEDSYILQVGSSTGPLIGILEKRLFYITISIPFTLIASGIIGHFFVKRALRPVADIAKAAQSITHEDLSSRIELRHIDDEFRQLISSFNEMIARLERSFLHISDFSSHVAHELKTPIAIIRGESEVALRKERDAEEYKRVIRTSLEESQRILKTIEDLLLLSKLDYRFEIFKFEEIDLVEFLKEVSEQSKVMASEKDVSVGISVPEERITVKADMIHLRRMFFNIIHNAVKFTHPGGRVDITLSPEKGRVRVDIKDTGIGISEEDLPRIFDRFFHIDKTGAEQGNGLGLSIALSISKMHNGDISVKSSPGEGSTFTVTLPV